MEMFPRHPSLEGNARSFVHLLLRKGYQESMTMESDLGHPLYGPIEYCLAQLQQRLQEQQAASIVFALSLTASLSLLQDRQCRLNIDYGHHQGFLIRQVTISNGTTRRVRIISLTDNEQLPFLRHVREGHLDSPAGPYGFGHLLHFFDFKSSRP